MIDFFTALSGMIDLIIGLFGGDDKEKESARRQKECREADDARLESLRSRDEERKNNRGY